MKPIHSGSRLAHRPCALAGGKGEDVEEQKAEENQSVPELEAAVFCLAEGAPKRY